MTLRDRFLNAIVAPMEGDDIGVCHVCGLKVAVSIADHSVMHALPTCTRFDELDALAFIMELRRARDDASRRGGTK